jgi:hypothetical protein
MPATPRAGCTAPLVSSGASGQRGNARARGAMKSMPACGACQPASECFCSLLHFKRAHKRTPHATTHISLPACPLQIVHHLAAVSIVALKVRPNHKLVAHARPSLQTADRSLSRPQPRRQYSIENPNTRGKFLVNTLLKIQTPGVNSTAFRNVCIPLVTKLPPQYLPIPQIIT